MLEILAILIGALMPILVNKSTENARFDFIKPYLREAWAIVFAFYVLYLLNRPGPLEAVMELHKRMPGIIGYIVVNTLGLVVITAYWWFTGRIFTTSQVNETPKPPAVPSESLAGGVSIKKESAHQPTTASLPTNRATSDNGEKRVSDKKVDKSVVQNMTNSPGGIQATGDVNIGSPPPKVNKEWTRRNVLENDKYISEVKIVIDSKTAIPIIFVRFLGKKIVKVDIVPGNLISFNQGDGYHEVSVQNAFGQYYAGAWTSEPESLEVEIHY